jgi:hypothetical protein
MPSDRAAAVRRTDRLGDAERRALAGDVAGEVVLWTVGKLVGVVANLIADRGE